jgi:hypothetical protein
MQQWYDLEGVASSISFSRDCDALISQYESSQCSTNSLYAIINFGRGLTPTYIPVVWKLAHNKLMTRDKEEHEQTFLLHFLQ